MSQPQPYQDLVLGSGAGGKLLAWHLGRSGRRVAVVERRWVGGSCPNIACLPSKNEIWSAKVADLLRHAAQFGIVTGSVAVDMARVRQHKREMVEGLVALHLDLYRKSGAELIMGEGRFTAPKTLEVRLRDGGTRVLTGERVFLNVGTRATVPPIPGLADARPLTHIEALELDRLPAHLLVLGGGYVGLELAQAYRRFGSRVTVIEYGPQLAGREGPDVAEALGQLFADEGIEVLLSTEALQVEGRSGEGVRLRVRTPQGERLLHGAGRRPARESARGASLPGGAFPPAGRSGQKQGRSAEWWLHGGGNWVALPGVAMQNHWFGVEARASEGARWMRTASGR